MEKGRYRIKITSQAKLQIRDIAKYIALELQNPDAALKLIDLFEKAIQSLEQFPERYALVEEKIWRDRKVHYVVVNNYLVYFKVDTAKFEIYVIAVIYGGRNQQQALLEIVENQ